MTQAELADELAKDHARVVDLIDRFHREDVEDRYELLLDSIADRFANVELHKHEKTFRPLTGIITTYGSKDPGAALARMRGRASKLEAIIEELRRNPTAKLRSKPVPISHDPEDVAADLKPTLAELRELERKAPNISEDDYKSVLRGAAGRLNESGLDAEAKQFTPPLLGRESLEVLKVIIGRHANALENLIKSLTKDRGYWMGRLKGGSGRAAPRPARTDEYIATSRIEELRGLPSTEWDVRRLLRICEEINVAYANDCLFSLAMLVRSVLDHIPPVFGELNFDGVVARAKRPYQKASKSLQDWRVIADRALHLHIDHHSPLMTPELVDVNKQLSVLIDEVITRVKKDSATP